jgi:dipeptidyl aminopeptidase/acylaminoacyl peptidase
MSKIAAPVFIYQGVNDPVTPREQADRMVAALRERKVPVEYMLLDNEGHGVVRRENRIAYLARVVRFLGEHLDRRESAPIDRRGAQIPKDQLTAAA